ncbi:MAG: hypothetical protein OXH65_03765 [Paracoccaceae bacterium]|nr:hypothetical protein [Paracoccaceae bacterium]
MATQHEMATLLKKADGLFVLWIEEAKNRKSDHVEVPKADIVKLQKELGRVKQWIDGGCRPGTFPT